MSPTNVASRQDGTRIDPAWLIAAMEECEVGSAALARRLEVDDTTVYRWRKDPERSPITRLIWLAVLGALGLPTDWQPKRVKRPRR